MKEDHTGKFPIVPIYHWIHAVSFKNLFFPSLNNNNNKTLSTQVSLIVQFYVHIFHLENLI